LFHLLLHNLFIDTLNSPNFRRTVSNDVMGVEYWHWKLFKEAV